MRTRGRQVGLAIVAAVMAVGLATARTSADEEQIRALVESETWQELEAEFGRRHEAVVRGPLGSRTNPVRASEPAGQRAYLSRLICPGTGEPPGGPPRQGSTGGGPYGKLLDKYEIECGEELQIVFLDMYHSHVEERPLPGFRIASGLVRTLERDEEGRYYEREGGELADGVYELEDREGRVRRRLSAQEGRLEGFYETFDENGTRRTRQELLDGDRNGVATWFDAEGRPTVQTVLDDCDFHGPVLWFAEDGHVQSQGWYYRGIAVGEWVEYDAEGEVTESEWRDGFVEPDDDE